MTKAGDRLQFPLNSFWVSEPFISGGYIGIGKFEETEESCKVISPGEGIINEVVGNRVLIEVESRGRLVNVEMEPIQLESKCVGDTIKKGEEIGHTLSPHLRITCSVKSKYTIIVNPMKEFYLHKHQYNRKNIPNHTPRPVPRGFED